MIDGRRSYDEPFQKGRKWITVFRIYGGEVCVVKSKRKSTAYAKGEQWIRAV